MITKKEQIKKDKWGLTGDKNIDLLNEVFGDVELTKDEEHSLLWLANWETSTIKNIVSAFEKIKGR